MSLENSKTDCCRRKILLPFNPNSIAKSRRLYEWALSNIIRPDLDHVYLFSVLHIRGIYNTPVMTDVWTFGMAGYPCTSTSYHEEYQRYIQNERETVRDTLKTLSRELAARNVTSSVITGEGNVTEGILKICETVKPDIVLIGSPSPKSKIRSWLNRSTLNYVRNNVKHITVLSDADNEGFIRSKNNKIREPKMSKQGIGRVIQKAMKQVKPKSGIDTETSILNKTYRKLED